MKKFYKILAGVICVALLVAPFFLIPKNNAKSEENLAILTIWHIDTFEGGKNSRCNFLREQANAFSKNNEGVYFLVSNHTVLSANNLLKKGSIPDIISYGYCNIDLSGKVKELNVGDLGGAVGNKKYAVSYLKGGYYAIKKGGGGEEIILSKGEHTTPEIACLFSSERSKNLVVKSPLDAYNYFLTKKQATLIGTQRDIYRLQNRNIEFTATPISGYSDLFQYLSLTTKSEKNEMLARKFIAYMLSSKVQSKISSLGMLSINQNNLYDKSEIMHSLENISIDYTFSPFSSENNYKTACEEGLKLLKSGEDSSKIIKFLKQL